jgi:hypothetical protein
MERRPMTAHVKLLIDNLRNAERPVTIPGIPVRGVSRDDCERYAFEAERLVWQFVTAYRALANNFNDNTRLDAPRIDVESYLQDVLNFGLDHAGEYRGMADRLDDLREGDR